ncbi:MAG: hypothetical protein NUV57_05690, partial [archaeon]|nr:hypothetical protein [archaeon]
GKVLGLNVRTPKIFAGLFDERKVTPGLKREGVQSAYVSEFFSQESVMDFRTLQNFGEVRAVEKIRSVIAELNKDPRLNKRLNISLENIFYEPSTESVIIFDAN